ncbi:MAG TPA: 50S ribosomal protein L6 [Dissulfurispiraceae bacterium]|nr:50S ribosomal protein L6 [Dissulfurispiraceae bacterium]
MSRIGKKPIDIPQKVNVDIKGDLIKVKGPLGELSYTSPASIKAAVDSGKVVIERSTDLQKDRALHGLVRSLVANMVNGVSQGFKKQLEVKGVGYRAQAKGNKITFTLGYSHPIEFELPTGVTATTDEKMTIITLSGIEKQMLGQVAANLRKLRAPDVYKGKGVRFVGERLKMKAGKTGKK